MKHPYSKAAMIILSGILITAPGMTSGFARSQNQGNESLVSATAETVSDSKITLKIYNAFGRNSMLKNADISVETNNSGHVSLIGKLKTDAQFNEAIRVAEAIEGVKIVNTDYLYVNASQQPLSDTWITMKTKAVLLKNGLPTDISVETKNGVVYLSGSATQKQSDQAKKIASNIEGVKSVNNQLEIQ
jgi:osmotically-inducible protein OsmY